MTDQSALLAAILAYPEDDTPRLVFADWLDENESSVTCEACGGSGRTCEFCHGTGTCEHHTGNGVMNCPNSYEDDGDKCYYVGRCLGDDDCPTCDGSGFVSNGYAARGEFIRIQCELARWEAKPVSEGDFRAVKWENFGRFYVGAESELKGLADQEYKLWRLHGHEFGRDLPGEMPSILMGCTLSAGVPSRIEYRFLRGFVDSVSCPWDAWRDHGDAILAAQPVRKVTLTSYPPPPSGRVGGGNLRDKCVRELSARWPSVREWVLPVDEQQSFTEVLESQRDNILRGMGIPPAVFRLAQVNLTRPTGVVAPPVIRPPFTGS